MLMNKKCRLCENNTNISIEAGSSYDCAFKIKPALNNGTYFVSVAMGEFLNGFQNKDHYTIIQFIGDAITIDSKTSAIYPGLVNFKSTFVSFERNLSSS